MGGTGGGRRAVKARAPVSKRRQGLLTRTSSAPLEERVQASDLAVWTTSTCPETGDTLSARGLGLLGRDGGPVPSAPVSNVPAGADGAAVAHHELALAMRHVYPRLCNLLEGVEGKLLDLYTRPISGSKASLQELVGRECAAAEAAGHRYQSHARDVFAQWAAFLDVLIAFKTLVTRTARRYPPLEHRRGRKHEPALDLAAELIAAQLRQHDPGASDRAIARAVAEELQAAGNDLRYLDNPADAVRKRLTRGKGGRVGHK